MIFPRLFNVLGPFWALLGVRKQGASTLSLSVSRSDLSVSRPQKSSGATLGHLGAFLGAMMVQGSPHDGLKMAKDGLKMAKDDPRKTASTTLSLSW